MPACMNGSPSSTSDYHQITTTQRPKVPLGHVPVGVPLDHTTSPLRNKSPEDSSRRISMNLETHRYIKIRKSSMCIHLFILWLGMIGLCLGQTLYMNASLLENQVGYPYFRNMSHLSQHLPVVGNVVVYIAAGSYNASVINLSQTRYNLTLLAVEPNVSFTSTIPEIIRATTSDISVTLYKIRFLLFSSSIVGIGSSRISVLIKECIFDQTFNISTPLVSINNQDCLITFDGCLFSNLRYRTGSSGSVYFLEDINSALFESCLFKNCGMTVRNFAVIFGKT